VEDDFLVSVAGAGMWSGVTMNSMLTHTSPDLAWSRGNHALVTSVSKLCWNEPFLIP